MYLMSHPCRVPGEARTAGAIDGLTWRNVVGSSTTDLDISLAEYTAGGLIVIASGVA